MKTKIPFLDLSAMHAELADELNDAWQRVSTSSKFIGGEFVDRFEESWAAYCGVKHCVGVSDGTSALELSLRALGISPGDEVIVPTNTFIATWEAIISVGARPIAIDIDPQTLLMTAEAVETACSKRTVGVIAVHLFGQPANMDLICRTAKRLGLWVVEDAAQAHGATWRGNRAGSLADVGCFSFYPGKNLGAFGDAGAVVTNDLHVAEIVRSLANHGRQINAADQHVRIGHNHRLDGLQAAILSAKLPHLDRWNAGRAEAAKNYRTALAGLPVEFIETTKNAVSSHHLTVVRVNNRDQVQHDLAAEGVATGIHYRTPCHLQPAYRHLNGGELPVAERAAKRILSLPMFPHLSNTQIFRVASVLRRSLARRSELNSSTERQPELM